MPETSYIKLSNFFFVREERALLNDVSISIEEGKTTVILGIAGSGKTTLLKAIAGLLIPDSGVLEFSGINVADFSKKDVLKLRKKDGFVFQDAALWANMSIEENLSLPIQFHYPDIPKDAIREKIDYWIKRVGFWDTIKGRPAAYSNGERKMISFIRALIAEPACLYLDAPTEMVDNSGTVKIMEILREQKQKGCTIIIVTQVPEIITTLADDIIVIDEGRIIEHGPVDKILSSENISTKRVLTHVRKTQGIDFNQLMKDVDSVLNREDIFDIEGIIESESNLGQEE